PRGVVQELHDSVGDRSRNDVGSVGHQRAIIVARDVAHFEDHGWGMGRYGVLKTTPVESEIAPHAVGDMYRIVIKSRRRAVRILDVVEQRILIGSAPRTMRHLESAVLADAVAIRMKR